MKCYLNVITCATGANPKISLLCLGYLSSTEIVPRGRIRDCQVRKRLYHWIERGRLGKSENHYMGQNDEAIRSCWQEWVNNGSFQCHDDNDRLWATAD
ncbi:hypothetical protein TNCV_1443821 [Trichonephila clavipes]|nr:hypothetical protein TNCV_1443821 [Trichonephila clavipes]